MSRIGKKPIDVPSGVKVDVADRTVRAKGPKGELEWTVPVGISVTLADGQVKVSRSGDSRQQLALHGLSRALLNNMVNGVNQPYERRLEIQGVGYQATLNSGILALQVGFSHSVDLKVPADVTCTLQSPTLVVLSSCDKHAVGQFAANVRAVRPPEPYKGKGIRYQGERVRRKSGKAFGSK